MMEEKTQYNKTERDRDGEMNWEATAAAAVKRCLPLVKLQLLLPSSSSGSTVHIQEYCRNRGITHTLTSSSY